MVDMKCEICGATWTKDDSFRGTEIKCPNCQGTCKCLENDQQDADGYECASCGLPCPDGIARCPACGGEVIASLRDVEKEVSDGKEKSGESQFWENFFWGCIFPEPTFLLSLVSLFDRNIRIDRKISAGFMCGAMLRFAVIVVLFITVMK